MIRTDRFMQMTKKHIETLELSEDIRIIYNGNELLLDSNNIMETTLLFANTNLPPGYKMTLENAKEEFEDIMKIVHDRNHDHNRYIKNRECRIELRSVLTDLFPISEDEEA